MEKALAIEVAPFALARGVTEETVLEASERLEHEFLSRADGYLGRLLVREDAKGWADIVFWKSAEHAARAMAAAAASPACSAYFQCMAGSDHDEPSSGVTLFRSMKAYGSVLAG